MENSFAGHGQGDTPGGAPGEMGEAAWADVLRAVDRTYAELVDYQEKLESRNAELRALRGVLASIRESIGDYLVVTDRDGLIVEASASFCAMAGVAEARAVGRPFLGFLEPDARAALGRAIEQALMDRSVAGVEAPLSGRDGPEPVEWRVAPRQEQRRRVGVVLTGRPLGELRRAYSELAEGHERLKQAQTLLVRNEKLASLGRLLAGVAHELNNPISFVYANSHALGKYVDRFEQYFERVQAGASREELVELRAKLRLDRDLKNLRSALNGAQEGAERVRDIVADLRRLSADGTGDMVPFDLGDCARVAASWVERGSRSELRITFEGACDGPALGRPGHIQQVLMNLVQNAADAMAGQADAEVTLRLHSDAGREMIDICDNGPGVPEELTAAIFDPFFTTKDVGAGTGLGLAISAKIVEEHGGTLELLPQESGACFRVALRRAEAGKDTGRDAGKGTEPE
ncbi:sensor histidine kinase [Sagittula sp.]|uniref:sensor histidine kinase n=1 Tax=Sagittula sp. TaxID=2038081 RepID=UPI00351274DE